MIVRLIPMDRGVVVEALEAHRLAPSRYTSYLSMLNDKEEGKYRAHL